MLSTALHHSDSTVLAVDSTVLFRSRLKSTLKLARGYLYSECCKLLISIPVPQAPISDLLCVPNKRAAQQIKTPSQIPETPQINR